MNYRKALSILLVLFTVGCASNGEHVHSFSSEWKFNETYHWHECNDDECNVKSDKGNHNLQPLVEDNHYYSACYCGYKKHRHATSEKWQSDETYHWLECLDISCDEILRKGEHTFKHIQEGLYEYDLCEVCGRKMNEKEIVDFEFNDMKKEYNLVKEKPHSYLTALFEDRTKFLEKMDEASQPINISWGLDEGVTSLKLYYGLNSDFSDAKEVELEVNTKNYSFVNLFKSSTYYVKVEETIASGTKTISTSFNTSSLGPRAMVVDGIKNVRDIGGYKINNATTSQGLIYRGGQLAIDAAEVYNFALTEKGKQTMSEELNIKTEIDLRDKSENAEIIETSLIPGCNLVYQVIDGYRINDFKKQYKEIFTILSKPSSYPIYYHCTGGADRTGTLSYLINAFLGVEEIDLIHDYEFTSFSPYDIRCTTNGTYSSKSYWGNLMSEIESYEGDNLQQKATNYLLSTGLTQKQLDNIKLIMTGHIKEVQE